MAKDTDQITGIKGWECLCEHREIDRDTLVRDMS